MSDVPARLRGAARVCLTAGVLTLATPAIASAHAALTSPVASDYQATVTSVPDGIAVRIVDGDQQLWMSVNPRLTAVILGLRGEPYLRFGPGGIDENLRSPTLYLNRAVPAEIPPDLSNSRAPEWRRLSGGHTLMWHEDRLHALALGAHSGSAGSVGSWLVPVVLDGRRTQVRGALDFRPAPTRVWLWPLVIVLACIPALLRLRTSRITRRTVRAAALLGLPAIVVGRLGRELYGHPDVSLGQTIDMVATVVIAALLAVGLMRRRGWEPAALIASGLALYEGLALAPTLEHGFVLAVDPAVVERSAASIALAAGAAGLLAIVFVGDEA